MLDWEWLTTLTDEALAAHDIAAVNLACAVGLPGAEEIDAEGCLRTLDRWADFARRRTAHFADAFRRDPDRYGHSAVIFHSLELVTALQQCGVRYNPDRIGAKLSDPWVLSDQFINGVIQGPGGTCASLPVVVAAVGRRLGYPMKLARTAGHVFARWVDPQTGAYTNICWSEPGMNTHSDDYLRSWPYTVTPEMERECCFLETLSPREELAMFVVDRALLWREAGDFRRTAEDMLRAIELHPRNKGYVRALEGWCYEWYKRDGAKWAPGIPAMLAGLDPSRRRWPRIVWEFERDILLLMAIDDWRRELKAVEDRNAVAYEGSGRGPLHRWADLDLLIQGR